jgi:hypothetical protein
MRMKGAQYFGRLSSCALGDSGESAEISLTLLLYGSMLDSAELGASTQRERWASEVQ